MFDRILKTRLELLRPNLKKTVEKNQNNQKRNFGGGKTKEFIKDKKVLVRDYRHRDKWDSTKVIKMLGSVVYEVELNYSLGSKRHVDQMQLNEENSEFATQITTNNEDSQIEQPNWVVPVTFMKHRQTRWNANFIKSANQTFRMNLKFMPNRRTEENAIQPLPSVNSPIVRKSTRIRGPVERLNL